MERRNFHETGILENLVEQVDESTLTGTDTCTAEAGGRSTEGKVIGGHYEVLSVIGSGGMSTVYKARHSLLDRPVAIKIIHPANLIDTKALLRLKQEAQAATRLSHQNVVSVREFGLDSEGFPFLVMDYIDGKPLSQVIDEKKCLGAEITRTLISQVSAGLAHAHDRGIIHRDIKPSNIILSKNDAGADEVKIVDFGIAKSLASEKAVNLTQTGEVFGTPNYMSPEQCLGRSVDARSDIYSLGCLLYECLHGYPPFSGDSSIEVIMKHVTGAQITFDKNKTPAYLEELILKCMEREPARRFCSVAEFQRALMANQSEKNSSPFQQMRILSKRFGRTKGNTTITVFIAMIGLSALIYSSFPLWTSLRPGQNQVESANQAVLADELVKRAAIQRYLEEKEVLTQAVNLNRQVRSGKDPAFAQSLNNLAACYYNLDKYDESMKLCEEGLRLWKDVDDPRLDAVKAQSAIRLGLIHHSKGDYALSQNFYLKALPGYERGGVLYNKTVLANFLDCIAKNYEDLGDPAKATQYRQRANRERVAQP